MSKKVYKVGMAGAEYFVELTFPVGYYAVRTDGTVEQVQHLGYRELMGNPDNYPLFVYGEVMFAIGEQRKFLMKKLSELDKAQEVMMKIHSKAIHKAEWPETQAADFLSEEGMK